MFAPQSTAGADKSRTIPAAGAGKGLAIQRKLEIGAVNDPLEHEADRVADKVMRMPAAPFAQRKCADCEKGDKRVQRKPLASQITPYIQRKSSDVNSSFSSSNSSRIESPSGGQPLSSDVRSYMEPRFNADFSNVRVHSNQESAILSNQLSARAFTYRNNIFFSRDQYQPGSSEGKRLLAHELTHTIQQGHAVQRSPQVTTTTAPPKVQRIGIQSALDKFAEWAYNIPGFRLLTIIMGFNPINMRSTDRNAANILRALIELIPGGNFITQALDNHGVIKKAAAWVEQKLAVLGDIGGSIVAGLKRFMDSLSWSDIFDLGGVWERAKLIFTAPIVQLMAFGGSVVIEVLKMVKDAILKPLAALAKDTRGYDLLRALLGEDPITGEQVPRTPEILIAGFMKLIGQEEIWENIKKGKAIDRAWVWFQGALSGLLGLARSIPQKIIQTITSLTFQDIITVVGAFTKIVGAFVNIASDFFSWALNQVISLLEILFSVVAPDVIPYITKAKAAFTTILKNPIGFVGNLVRAAKLGFEMFANNILEHLKSALIKWLVGPLAEAGVYIPKSFSLMEIIKLVLSVLGLTWQNIRSKLVKIIPEPVLIGLEKTAGILVTLVNDGPAAAWEQIKAELTELKDMLISEVTQMVTTEIVKAAVTKLVSMLNPAGAVIQAIIAIYNTITFFIEKIKQIAAVVASFIDSISAIASGQVDAAAKKVELTMANTLTVVIAFLAKFAGLGGIPNKIVGIIQKIRKPIDKGLDKIVAWLGKILNKVKEAVSTWWKNRIGFTNSAGEKHTLSFNGEETSAVLTIESTPRPLATFLSEFIPKDDKEKGIIAAIQQKGVDIENIKTNNGTRRGRSDFNKNDGEKISTVFKEIVKLLSQLSGVGSPPITVLKAWNTNNEDGQSITAEPLSINPPATGEVGSKPFEESTLWKEVSASFPGKYARGHLLNHHVHGPGIKKNLTPITIGANNKMERYAESDVKKAVLGENKVIHYDVKVASYHEKEKKKIFSKADQLPAVIIMNAYELDRDDTGWKNGKAILTEKTVESPFPPT